MTPTTPARQRNRSDSHATPGIALAAAMSARPLSAGHVQVVFADTDDWLAWEDEAYSLLDAHEQTRVSRQRMPRERRVRAVAYAMHRLLLARALDCDPADVPLYRDASGCPQLEGGVAWTSLSHAGSLLALAIAADGPVGVDIEPASRAGAIGDIAGSVCHPREWDVLASWPATPRAAALLELWVRKEAVLKAAGVGLEVPMESFEALHATPVRVPGFPTSWHVTTLDAGCNATAAVAVAADMEVECVRLRPCHVNAACKTRAAHVDAS